VNCMITIYLDKELDTLIYTVVGDVVYAEIRDVIDTYYKGKLTKYTIGDYSQANPTKHLSGEETQQLGLQVKSLAAKRPNGIDLLVVPGIVQYGVARMYKTYSEMPGNGAQKLRLRIFNKKEDALAFIRQNEQPPKEDK